MVEIILDKCLEPHFHQQTPFAFPLLRLSGLSGPKFSPIRIPFFIAHISLLDQSQAISKGIRPAKEVRE
jgi:hypothetical protein